MRRNVNDFSSYNFNSFKLKLKLKLLSYIRILTYQSTVPYAISWRWVFWKVLKKKFNLANLVRLFQEAQDLVFECVFVCVLDGLRLIVWRYFRRHFGTSTEAKNYLVCHRRCSIRLIGVTFRGLGAYELFFISK